MTTSTTAATSFLIDPFLFLQKSVTDGSACLVFEDEHEARRYFQRIRALTHGRAKSLGAYVWRSGLVVSAATAPEAMPGAKLS